MNNCNKMQCQCKVPQREAVLRTPAPSCGCACFDNDTCPIDFGNKDCCGSRSFDESFALAMGYVPVQKWTGIMECDEGLRNGTVFSDLVKPFCAAGRRKAL